MIMDLNKEIIESCYKIINRDKDRQTWDILAQNYSFANGEALRQKFKAYRKKKGELKSTPSKSTCNCNGDCTEKSTNKSTVKINKDGSHESDKVVSITDESQLNDQDFLLKAHGFDTSKWKIIECKSSLWDTQKKGGEIVKLCASKIKVKPINGGVWNSDLVKKISECFQNTSVPNIYIDRSYDSGDKLLFVRLADFHYNLKAERFTTGNEYNVKIAEDGFKRIISEVYDSYKDSDIDRVLFTIGDDFINADNIQGTTTRGTPQSNDLDWESALIRATELIKDGILTLSDIAPVDVMNIQSNHDQHTMFGLTEILKATYKDVSCITVINKPQPNNFYKYGDNLLWLAHDTDVKRALQTLTEQASDYFGHCKNFMCFLAHYHQAIEYGKHGILEIMRMPTASGWSRWSNSNNYRNTEKRTDIYLIDRQKGITDKKIIRL
jgi:hypothetical protein